MNDFTIDELNILIHYIGLTLDKVGLDLSVKIQSMIENYCEHEWQFYYMGPHGNAVRCNKCNKGIP